MKIGNCQNYVICHKDLITTLWYRVYDGNIYKEDVAKLDTELTVGVRNCIGTDANNQ